MTVKIGKKMVKAYFVGNLCRMDLYRELDNP